MSVQELLLETLEDLIEDDFKKLKWFLSMKIRDSCKPIPTSRLETASRIDTVRRMMESYSEDTAVSLTVEILRKMNHNEAAGRLESAYAGQKAATPATTPASSAAPAPAAPAPAAPGTISAEGGSVIIAPQLGSTSTSGTWNITINKMEVPPLILDTLDELGADEFKRFRWYLTQPVLAGCEPIRKVYLESADRQDTVSKMIDGYGAESAVNVTAEILKRMNHNSAVEKLKRRYAGVA
uniref:uncharacterized protein n=1 Tax=Semicossyphus pulcher TaxID=241346 RepID=UPI0037E70E9E